MDNLLKLINDIVDRDFTITKSSTTEQLQQTQRNALKQELLQAIFNDIASKYDFVFKAKEGILFEIANNKVADTIENEEGSGAITICIDVKVKDLNTNAEFLADSYNLDKQNKALKAEKKAEAKAKKIADDAKWREQRKQAKANK